MAAELHPQAWWHLARASGIVAWALLAASVLWGLALSSRVLGRSPGPARLLDLHRHLGALAVVFTGVHLAALVADSYVHFGAADLLVPFASTWRPWAVAWGVVGLYLLLAVELTSLARRRLPHRLWRRVHLASFPLAAVATAHLWTAGADAGNTALRAAVAGTGVLAAILAAARVAGGRGARARPGPAPGAVTAAVAVAAAAPPPAHRGGRGALGLDPLPPAGRA